MSTALKKTALLLLLCLGLPAGAAATLPPVAVFPLQELGQARNDVNLPFSRELARRLAAAGNEISNWDTMMAFMANNRIRTVGHLETFHVSQVGVELGAAFILLGTVSQLKERPIPALGLTLQLVRTSDGRTVWSYVGHVSTADARRILGIGEPRTIADLQELLITEVLTRWPWQSIGETQTGAAVNIDSVLIRPDHLKPGDEVHLQVRFRDRWLPGRAPRVFFQAGEQIHAASPTGPDGAYEASWPVGDSNGRFSVTLIREWPLYERRESAPLGSYLVDGTPPLMELALRGGRSRGTEPQPGQEAEGGEEIPVFNDQLVIMPRMLVRKPLARWRLAFYDESGMLVGADEERGNLPEHLVWRGQGKDGRLESGIYRIVVEAWDRAGNNASVSRLVELNRSSPEVALTAARHGDELTVDLEQQGKLPLAYWRLEMWTSEGRILSTSEGRELPAQVELDLTDAREAEDIQGVLVVQDILGNRIRRDVREILRKIGPQESKEVKDAQPAGLSESWVDEF